LTYFFKNSLLRSQRNSFFKEYLLKGYQSQVYSMNDKHLLQKNLGLLKGYLGRSFIVKITNLKTFRHASDLHEVVDRDPPGPEGHPLHQDLDVLGNLGGGKTRWFCHRNFCDHCPENSKDLSFRRKHRLELLSLKHVNC